MRLLHLEDAERIRGLYIHRRTGADQQADQALARATIESESRAEICGKRSFLRSMGVPGKSESLFRRICTRIHRSEIRALTHWVLAVAGCLVTWTFFVLPATAQSNISGTWTGYRSWTDCPNPQSNCSIGVRNTPATLNLAQNGSTVIGRRFFTWFISKLGKEPGPGASTAHSLEGTWCLAQLG